MENILSESQSWANNTLSNIKKALAEPSFSIKGFELVLYNELKDSGVLNDLPISDSNNDIFYVNIFKFLKYRELKGKNKGDVVSKPSKWQIVSGAMKHTR
ncbi:MAG: hypothetical protein WDA06_02825 [Phenylobacterium sp.]